MKRRRRLHAKLPSDLRVEADVATATVADGALPRSRRYSRMKLPHERDESTHRPARPDGVTEQAAQDIEQGKVDTDCYGAAGPNYDAKHRR